MVETVDPVKWFNENFEQYVDQMSLDQKHMQGYVRLLQNFCMLVGQNGKVLDTGCGWGRDVNYLLEKGYDAAGVDKAPRPLRYGQENYEKVGDRLRRMDIGDLDFQDETFDGVWCNSVIHFYKPEKMRKVLLELQRVLKTNGILYINFKLTEGAPEKDIRTEEDGSKVKRYLVPKKEVEDMMPENLEILREPSEINTEDFENPVWGIFCRKKA